MIGVPDILKLTKQFLPTGRAWKVPHGSNFEKLLKGLNESEVRAINFALSTLSRILPDNDNFTVDDATQWERRLNLPIAPQFVPLEDRKNIILRKYQFPGNFLNRQNYRYIEAQLQLAGFDITIEENTDSNLIIGISFQHDIDNEHGLDTEMGSVEVDLIANSAFKGELYDVSSPLGVFLITGTISPLLITNFRKLVLKLKPVDTVALLFLTYAEIIYSYLEDGMFLMDGIFLMDSTSTPIYSDNFSSWTDDGAFTTVPVKWPNSSGRFDNVTIGRDSSVNLIKTGTGCKMILNPDIYPDGSVQIDTYTSLPFGTLEDLTNYRVSFDLITSSNKGDMVFDAFTGNSSFITHTLNSSGSYSYDFTTTSTGHISGGRMVFSLFKDFSNWHLGDGEIWCEIQNVKLEKLS